MRHPAPLHQDRAFRVLLVGTLLALVAILAPFLYAFAIAAVLVVVTWPAYAWISIRTGHRPRLAAVLMMAGLLLLIALPVSAMTALAVGEAVAAADRAMDLISRGNVEQWTADVTAWFGTLRGTGALDRVLPPPDQLLQRSTRAVEDLLLEFTRSVGAGLPGVVGGFGRAAMDALVFSVALFSGYVRGPDMVQAVRQLSPLRPEYLERLFDVFAQLSTNVALGMVVAGAGQGLVAAIGFWLAGVPASVALGFATALTSVIPVFGSLVVWAPVAVGLLLQGHVRAAIFVIVWSSTLTGLVDNLIKPLAFRNKLQVSPIWMLLALLGGLLVLGPRGLVVGPFVLVSFLTLYTLYVRDFVDGQEQHQEAPAETRGQPSS